MLLAAIYVSSENSASTLTTPYDSPQLLLLTFISPIPVQRKIPRHGKFHGAHAFPCSREYSTEAIQQYYNNLLY